jgi:hypothetical protein
MVKKGFVVRKSLVRREGLLNPHRIDRQSGATPQPDLNVNTLGGKLDVSPTRQSH